MSINQKYMAELETAAAALNRAAAYAQALAAEGSEDDADAPEEAGAIEGAAIYPDPEATSNMIAAREYLAKFQEAKEYVAEIDDTHLSREAYLKVNSYIDRPNKSPGAPTFGMTGFTVRPSRTGYWPLPDGSGHVRPKANEPEGIELRTRLANSQKCYDAAQTVKQMVNGSLTPYGAALRKFLEEGETAGAKTVIDTWENFFRVYTECWPRSKYAPEPWKVGAE